MKVGFFSVWSHNKKRPENKRMNKVVMQSPCKERCGYGPTNLNISCNFIVNDYIFYVYAIGLISTCYISSIELSNQ